MMFADAVLWTNSYARTHKTNVATVYLDKLESHLSEN